MNKTSWQEHFWQISGALVAALCQDPAPKLVRVYDKNNNSCIMFIIFTSPKPGGDQRSMGIDQISLIINCMSILMQFLTFLKQIQCSHRFKLNLITLLVTLLCKWGQIIGG